MPVAPPRPRDPPLNALRAFEAAARLGGFAAAAQELGVTPGAVTAHVKALEAALGAALFERTARGVRLTPLGEKAAPRLAAAFDALSGAVQALRADAGLGVVHVATSPAVAQFWLTPRLPALRAALPGIDVSVTALEAPPALKRQRYDLALFYDAGTDGRLAEDVIFPVCAPALAARLRRPEDLSGVPCLSDTAWAGDWQAWAAAALPGGRLAVRGPAFSLYALAVAEAVAGAGVLIGHGALVAGHLARGELVAPFPQQVTLPRGLRLWPARQAAPAAPAMQVLRWLRASV